MSNIDCFCLETIWENARAAQVYQGNPNSSHNRQATPFIDPYFLTARVKLSSFYYSLFRAFIYMFMFKNEMRSHRMNWGYINIKHINKYTKGRQEWSKNNGVQLKLIYFTALHFSCMLAIFILGIDYGVCNKI